MFVQSAPEGLSFFYFILRAGDNKDHNVCIDKVVIDEIFFANEEQTYKEYKIRNQQDGSMDSQKYFGWLKTWFLLTAHPLPSQIRGVQVLKRVAF